MVNIKDGFSSSNGCISRAPSRDIFLQCYLFYWLGDNRGRLLRSLNPANVQPSSFSLKIPFRFGLANRAMVIVSGIQQTKEQLQNS